MEAGQPPGGLCAGRALFTANGGDTWVQLRDGMFNGFVIMVAVDKADHKVVYAGTEGGGIFNTVRP